MGLPEEGQEQNLTNPHTLNLTEFEAPWYVGLVLVVGGAAATVMYMLDKATQWGWL